MTTWSIERKGDDLGRPIVTVDAETAGEALSRAMQFVACWPDILDGRPLVVHEISEPWFGDIPHISSSAEWIDEQASTQETI